MHADMHRNFLSTVTTNYLYNLMSWERERGRERERKERKRVGERERRKKERKRDDLVVKIYLYTMRRSRFTGQNISFLQNDL